MKPKDLKCPFKWNERQPFLMSKVLFVPHHYFEHEAWVCPEFDDLRMFGRRAPVFVEYCSGNGDWVIQKAKENPEYNWIAVEKRFDRVRKIWSKMNNENVTNLLVVSGEAWTFSHYYLKENSVDGCYINFPDPWPKGKHVKHRLFHDLFVQEMSRVLKGVSKATVATDDPLWARRIFDAMESNPCWKSLFTDPFYVTELGSYGFSFFDQLWRDEGRTIHYLQFANHKTV